MQINGFDLACPRCRGELTLTSTSDALCPAEQMTYSRIDGIWDFLSPERGGYYAKFLDQYQTIRQAEGRGSTEAAYYQALPFRDLTGRMSRDWRIRAKSYTALINHVVEEKEQTQGRQLICLDLGAGNAWLSYRLAQRGHFAAAIDLVTNNWDGLGAWQHYGIPILPIRAEFNSLPFSGNQCDLAIFNASLHYSTKYEETLRESLRVLKPGGAIVVLDSPLYHSADSGRQMVAEREAGFIQRFGFPSNAIASENYLTYRRLDEIAAALGLEWRLLEPFYGLPWAMKPWLARLRGQREPASFKILVAGKAE